MKKRERAKEERKCMQNYCSKHARKGRPEALGVEHYVTICEEHVRNMEEDKQMEAIGAAAHFRISQAAT